MRQRTSASSPERRSRAVIVEDVGEPLPEGIPDRVDGGEWWRGAVSETKVITVSWRQERKRVNSCSCAVSTEAGCT